MILQTIYIQYTVIGKGRIENLNATYHNKFNNINDTMIMLNSIPTTL